MPETSPAAPGSVPISIQLPPDFTRGQQQAIHRYLRSQEPLHGDDWLQLIQAMEGSRRRPAKEEGEECPRN